MIQFVRIRAKDKSSTRINWPDYSKMRNLKESQRRRKFRLSPHDGLHEIELKSTNYKLDRPRVNHMTKVQILRNIQFDLVGFFALAGDTLNFTARKLSPDHPDSNDKTFSYCILFVLYISFISCAAFVGLALGRIQEGCSGFIRIINPLVMRMAFSEI